MACDPIERLLSEDVISSSEVADEIQPLWNKRPDRTTIYRWMLRGVQGVRLEHAKVGGRVVTSKQAFTRFIKARGQSGKA